MTHLAYRTYRLSPLNARHVVRDGKIAYEEPRRKRVGIFGAGIGKTWAPLDDPTWEIWAINLIPPIDSVGRLRADLWFDLHQHKAQSLEDLIWIARCPVPIYVPSDLVNAGSNCVEFPLASIGQGPFACTFAYQIALAIHEQATDIGLFGIELRYGTPRERTVEWASVNWWMGYAEARGVRVHVPSGSWLGAHPKLYGFEYDEEVVAVNEYLDTMKRMDAVEANRSSVGG